MRKLLLIFLMAASLYAADIKPVTGQDYRGWPDGSRLFYATGYHNCTI